MNGELEDEWVEITPNTQPFYFDEATEELQAIFRRSCPKSLTQLKHHANTWGLSSNNWLAENIFPKLNGLRKVDFSENLGRLPRSDINQSIANMLNVCFDKPIDEINVNNNSLGHDGARAFTKFLKNCKHLKTLKMDNCKLSHCSTELILKSVFKNKSLKITTISASGN